MWLSFWVLSEIIWAKIWFCWMKISKSVEILLRLDNPAFTISKLKTNFAVSKKFTLCTSLYQYVIHVFLCCHVVFFWPCNHLQDLVHCAHICLFQFVCVCIHNWVCIGCHVAILVFLFLTFFLSSKILPIVFLHSLSLPYFYSNIKSNIITPSKKLQQFLYQR